MVFQLDFKGPNHNARMHRGNALVVCDLYVFFLDFSLQNEPNC